MQKEMHRYPPGWYRLLRVDKTPDVYAHKKGILLNLYDSAISGGDIPAQPYIYERHQADIRQLAYIFDMLRNTPAQCGTDS